MKIVKFLFAVILFLGLQACSGSDDSDPGPLVDSTPPTIPTNFEAENITKNSVDFSWSASTDNIGVKAYILYKNGVNHAATTKTFYNVTGLDAGTNYTFNISARDAAGNESAYSNSVEFTTESNSATLIQSSGNLEVYLGGFINGVPGNSGNNYQIPTNEQLDIWNEVVTAILNENIQEAVTKSAEINYQINEFTDTSLSGNQVFYILEESSDKQFHWGTYVFAKTPTISNLVIQAPHIEYDTNTGKQAVYCFRENITKALFLSGTHRCNHSTASSCSGTTSACSSSSQAYRISDMAHNTNSMFQETTEIVFSNVSNSVFLQLHGFGKNDSDPYVIMSNGTRETPSTDYSVQLRDALLNEDSSLTFKIAHIDTDWNRLIGFTNTQGRYINGSSNPCLTSATSTTGRFIHIEQEKSKLRENSSGWSKMSNALKSVFN